MYKLSKIIFSFYSFGSLHTGFSFISVLDPIGLSIEDEILFGFVTVKLQMYETRILTVCVQ